MNFSLNFGGLLVQLRKYCERQKKCLQKSFPSVSFSKKNSQRLLSYHHLKRSTSKVNFVVDCYVSLETLEPLKIPKDGVTINNSSNINNKIKKMKAAEEEQDEVV